MTRASTLPADHLPQLSIAERDRRWRMLRERMKLRRLDALVCWANDAPFGFGIANFRYLSHIGSQHGGVMVLPLEGEPVVYQSPPHLHEPFVFYAVAQRWISDIRPFMGVASAVAGVRGCDAAEGRIGLVGFRTGLYGNMIAHEVVSRLEETFPRAHFEDATPLVEEARMIKSAEELGMLEQAARLAHRSIVRLHETAEPGVTELALTAAMLHEQVSNGGEPHTFNLMTSGPVDGDPGAWHLVHGVETQTERRLETGDLIVTEFHASRGGYLAAAEFSVHLGEPPAELRRIHEVAIECLQSYRDAMRPGRTVGEAWQIVRRPCIEAGLDFVELGFHGHGLASPEFPTVTYREGLPPLDHSGLKDVVIRENMVFGTNIDIFDPAWRPNVGIMLGDMLVVTEDAPRFLVETPIELFVKG